jgi:hypothetical protein
MFYCPKLLALDRSSSKVLRKYESLDAINTSQIAADSIRHLGVINIEKYTLLGICYIIVLEAEVIRVPVSNFGVLQVLLCGTFILQVQVVSVIALQLRLLGPAV